METRHQDNTRRRQDKKTAGQQDKTRGQQDKNTTRQEDSKTRQEDSKTSRQQDNQATRQDKETARQEADMTTRFVLGSSLFLFGWRARSRESCFCLRLQLLMLGVAVPGVLGAVFGLCLGCLLCGSSFWLSGLMFCIGVVGSCCWVEFAVLGSCCFIFGYSFWLLVSVRVVVWVKCSAFVQCVWCLGPVFGCWV